MVKSIDDPDSLDRSSVGSHDGSSDPLKGCSDGGRVREDLDRKDRGSRFGKLLRRSGHLVAGSALSGLRSLGLALAAIVTVPAAVPATLYYLTSRGLRGLHVTVGDLPGHDKAHTVMKFEVGLIASGLWSALEVFTGGRHIEVKWMDRELRKPEDLHGRARIARAVNRTGTLVAGSAYSVLKAFGYSMAAIVTAPVTIPASIYYFSSRGMETFTNEELPGTLKACNAMQHGAHYLSTAVESSLMIFTGGRKFEVHLEDDD